MRGLLDAPPRVVNVGLGVFARELAAGGADHLHVDWRPPAGADRDLAGWAAATATRPSG